MGVDTKTKKVYNEITKGKVKGDENGKHYNQGKNQWNRIRDSDC